MGKDEQHLKFIPKEISWLSFNNRVLMEAQDESVPLLERLRFLGIYANNLDEFFRVRVALLRRLVVTERDATQLLGDTPEKILKDVREEVLRQRKVFNDTQKKLHDELEENGIKIHRFSDLNEKQKEYLRGEFQTRVRLHLFPIMFEKASQIPNMDDSFPYLVIELKCEDDTNRYAVIKIPTDKIQRFIEMPHGDFRMNLVTLDDIIRVGLPEIFTPFSFTEINAYAIKITKDAELDINEDISETYRSIISKSVKARKKGELVRFEYDNKIPARIIDMFQKRFNISRLEVMIAGGTFRNFRDYLSFPDLGIKGTTYKPNKPVPVIGLNDSESILDQVQKRDFLLHYPYNSFDIFITFLREASIDPRVKEIRITLYRMSKDSAVANALINAAHNGKQVVVTLELQARFDEVNNLFWSEKMSEAGVQVIHGVPGVKVHAKICYVAGKEHGKVVQWAAVGTGNFNENTSRLYTDALLLTSQSEITDDVASIFQFFDHNYLRLNLKHLKLSPYDLRPWLLECIDSEISAAKKGLPASISAKLNQLVDPLIQKKLVQAAKAGVVVRLLIRGMCSLAPEPGGNIEIRRIVDRYLEHSRFIIFHNDGDPTVAMSSADWMVRNLDRRIEVTIPVLETSFREEFQSIFEIYWKDTAKAVYVEPTLQNIKITGEEKFRAQSELRKFLNSKKENK